MLKFRNENENEANHGPSRFDAVIVVCFVGGMLYYSMNVLWPRQSQAFFIPEGAIVMRGAYAVIFSCGTWRTYPTFSSPRMWHS